MDDDETLLVKPEVFLYKIPPSIQKKEGYIHRASDWDVANPSWYGRLTIFAAGPTCHVMLEDRKGDVFGQAVLEDYPGKVLNNVFDSSRYFVLRIQKKTGDFEKVGIGFSDRKDSGDLKSVLKNYFSSVNAAVKRPAAPDASSGDNPSKKVRIAEVKPEPKQSPAPEVLTDNIAKPASTLKATTAAGAIPATTISKVKPVPAEATATSKPAPLGDPSSKAASKDLNEGSSASLTGNKIPLVPAEKLVAKKAVVFAQPLAAKPKAPPPPKISKPPVVSVVSQPGAGNTPNSPQIPPNKDLKINTAKTDIPTVPKVQLTAANKAPEKAQLPVVSKPFAEPTPATTRSSSASEPSKKVEDMAKTILPPPTILKVAPMPASTPSASNQNSQPLKSILKKSHESIHSAPTVTPPAVMAAPAKVPLVPYSEGVSLVPYDEKTVESPRTEEMKMSVDEEIDLHEGKVATHAQETAKPARDSTTPRSARKIAGGQSADCTTASITESIIDSNTEIHTNVQVVKLMEAEAVLATPIHITPDDDQRKQENPPVSDEQTQSVQQDVGSATQAVVEPKHMVVASTDCESSDTKNRGKVLDQVILPNNPSEVDLRKSEEPDEKLSTLTEIPPEQVGNTGQSLMETKEIASSESNETLPVSIQPESEHEIVKPGKIACSTEEPLLLNKPQQEIETCDNQEQGNVEIVKLTEDIDMEKGEEESQSQEEDRDTGEQQVKPEEAFVEEQNGEQGMQKEVADDEGRDGMEQEQEDHVDQDEVEHLNEEGKNENQVEGNVCEEEEHTEGEGEYVDDSGHGEGENPEKAQGAAVDAENVGEGDQEAVEGGEEYAEGGDAEFIEGEGGEEYVEGEGAEAYVEGGGEEYVEEDGGEAYVEGEGGEEYVEGGDEEFVEGDGGEEYVGGGDEEFVEGDGGEEYVGGEGGEEYVEEDGGEAYVEGEGGEEYVEGEETEEYVEGTGGEECAGDAEIPDTSENPLGISEEPTEPEGATELCDINMVGDDSNMGDVENLEAAVDVFNDALENQEEADAVESSENQEEADAGESSENQETLQTDENMDETPSDELPSDNVQEDTLGDSMQEDAPDDSSENITLDQVTETLPGYKYRNGSLFQCHKCPETFNYSQEIMSHWADSHLYRNPIHCSVCKLPFPSKVEAAIHKKKIHGFTCSECSKSFKNDKTLEDHVRAVHGGGKKLQFPCSRCQESFKFKFQLVKHIEVDHENESGQVILPECSTCHEKFLNEKELAAHQVTHNDNYTCGECSQSFRSRGALRAHHRQDHQ